MPEAKLSCKKLYQADVSQPCSDKHDLGCGAPVFSIRAPVNSTDRFRELYLKTPFFLLELFFTVVLKLPV